ncbi:MAG: hypothetical protein WCA79_00400 [Anaerolineales bacterium]
MNKLWKFVLIFATMVIILACNLPSAAPTPTSQPNVATIVAGTLQAATDAAATSAAQITSTPTITPTATASPTPQALAVNYANIQLAIPSNLASGTTDVTTTDIEPPYINPSSGQMPQHAKIILNGYPVQGASWQPQIIVFNAGQYARYTDLTQHIISGLRSMHYQRGQPLPEGLPSGQFNADVQSINFANGNGIRYLTQFDQSPLPANNRELFYYFHGITNDGNYYVQVVLPIQSPFLPPDNNPSSPLPRNGIPFHGDQSYFNAVEQQLNATPPDQFSPSLTSLDALVQSIKVSP